MKTNWNILLIAGLGLSLLAGCSKHAIKTPEAQDQQVSSPETQPAAKETMKPAAEKKALRENKTTAVSFEDIRFDYDQYDLKPEALSILAKHASLLKAHPELNILIEGHCDERGTIEYNLALGEKRAGAAKEYLVRFGIAPKRLSIISYGKERPLDRIHTEDAWMKNRRAAFVIDR
jgi:peptidoglycan-associated lipoprotein